MTEGYRHLRPEDLQKFVPGVFYYEREAAMAERAIEAYKFYIRARVEALGVAHNTDEVYNQAITDVLALLSPDDEDQ